MAARSRRVEGSEHALALARVSELLSAHVKAGPHRHHLNHLRAHKTRPRVVAIPHPAARVPATTLAELEARITLPRITAQPRDMATRSRRSAAQEVVEEEEEQEGVRRLKFNQTLVNKPGKQIGLTELLARLKTLCDELREIEQEEADTESLTRSAKELASPGLIQHKDAGVRAWTACCIVEMFRLFAPNAPYTASQLKVSAPTGSLRRHCN